MLRNYLITAFRNLSKHKFHTALNILSLAIGIAACIIIFLFISEETAFDAHHSKAENIYRLCEVQSFPGTNTQNVALSMPGMGPAFIKDFPEAVNYTRYVGRENRLWVRGDQQFIIDKMSYVDSTFLQIFDFVMLEGDPATALDEPNTIVLTVETATKIFGRQDVVGETLEMIDNTYEITGILDNIPETSHLQFDILVSFTTITREDPEVNTQWGGNWLVTYFVLRPDADLDEMAKRYPEYLLSNSGRERINENYKLFLQPLKEVHLGSTDIEHDYQNYRKFNGKYLGIFTLVGIFILIIAAVNFMNLSTARAGTRAREVGVRKSIGANRGQLIRQFTIESVLMALVAGILALVISAAAIPYLNDLIGRTLSISTVLLDAKIIGLIVLASIGLGGLAGLYPSVYLASFKPVKVLKGIEATEGKSLFRSSMIVTQFSLALAMIVATLIVIQQLNYMRNKDIGFTKDHILLVDMNRTANENFKTLKQELLKNSHIQGVTASGQRIGNNFHQWGFKAEVDTGILQITPSNVHVDYDYLDVYEIELVAGRSFSKEFATDDGLAFIINESFAKELGFEEDPIGRRVGHSWYPNDSLGTIIGVTKDFNFNSLHFKVNTLSMVVHSGWGYDELSVKLNGQNIEEGVKQVESAWNEFVGDYPFKYSFLDDHFDQLYRSDQQMSSVISIIAVLSILIGSMGLFGLSAITMERRVKEIGIRKVLGANIQQLLIVLSKQFALLILVSFIIATPLTYLFLSGWLENFAFRVTINPIVFLIGGLMAFIIAMITISYHTVRVARANPVDSLRME